MAENSQSDDFFASRGNARSAGLHPEFYARLRSAIEDAESATGEKAKINSLTRTRDEQRAAYQRYRSGQGGLAAPPGTSRHEIGAAADIEPGKVLAAIKVAMAQIEKPRLPPDYEGRQVAQKVVRTILSYTDLVCRQY